MQNCTTSPRVLENDKDEGRLYSDSIRICMDLGTVADVRLVSISSGIVWGEREMCFDLITKQGFQWRCRWSNTLKSVIVTGFRGYQITTNSPEFCIYISD
jgi:hypothetical protein